MAINIDNERTGVLTEDTTSADMKFYAKNEYEPVLESGVILLEKLEDRSKWRLVEDLSQVGAITDMGSAVSTPGTIKELFNILRLFFLDDVASGGSYRKVIMPQQVVSDSSVSYTGFAYDLEAQTSEAKWAVKRMHQDGSETWAGKTTFDEILDNFLTLSYS
ncbi:MAG: hypothetical protein ACXABY_07100 [Candidatus Thorarchaeota archaeon]|jgi:hypothetical protein